MYRLKRQYGVPLAIYNVVTSEVDRDTGVRVRTLEKVEIARTLVLDSRAWMQFEYDLSWIMAGRPFSMGGHFDTSERRVIISVEDLGDFIIKGQGDRSYVVYDNKKYAISEIADFEERQAKVLKIKHVVNEVYNQIHDVNLFDFVDAGEELTQEIV